MAVERIRITTDRIITRNADGTVSFDSNELYIKTNPSGTLKAGGYQRCPTIIGYSTIFDVTEYGGFPIYIVPPNSTPTSFSVYYPKTGTVTIVQPTLPPFTAYEFYSSPATLTVGGVQVGSYRRLYEGAYTQPQQFHEIIGAWFIRELTFNAGFAGGTVTFNNPPNNYVYTKNTNGTFTYTSSYTTASFATSTNSSNGTLFMYTQPPINLSLSVTA